MNWLVWLGVGLAGAGLLKSRKRLNLPAKALPFLPALQRAAAAQQIPVRILAAFVQRESDWNPSRYNPESPAAMQSWACEIAGKPERWGRHPEYNQAVQVCALLERGETAAATAIWTFGSAGLMQVMRIVASERGGLRYDLPNDRLFDPALNLQTGARVVAARRERLYPGRVQLSDQEWAWVRAIYVGGPGILTQKPERAREIAEVFLAELRKIDG